MLRVLAVLLCALALAAPAKADVIVTYDWQFSAKAPPCGGGPGCIGYIGGALFQSGTFATTSAGADLLGTSGILSSTETNFGQIASSIHSVTILVNESQVPNDPTYSGFWDATNGFVAITVEWNTIGCDGPFCGPPGIYTGGSGGLTQLFYTLSVAQSVPETSTWAMLLLGFCGLGLLLHRQRADA
ncbi:hypothetical protein [Bradyrhizobium sp. WSM3983]|uniref:hypothetical protein n=1 Tax=Bradyrhizobium sp. WSM3983 TaxID=1038867 RepID=UPI0012EBBAAD|nr:hypothetical protein [Bradyrhizobium sp. WSM3983]